MHTNSPVMHTLRESDHSMTNGMMNGGLGSYNGHNNGQSSLDTNGFVKTEVEENPPAERELDIILNNVVCNFSVRCHLNLKHIAMNGLNVEFHKEMAVCNQRNNKLKCIELVNNLCFLLYTDAYHEVPETKMYCIYLVVWKNHNDWINHRDRCQNWCKKVC